MSEHQPENPSDSDSVVRERIHRQAAAFAEATVYSMNNIYLTKMQKAYVEEVYQLPIGLFWYILFGHLLFVEPQSYLDAFLVAAVSNVVVAIAWWFASNLRIANLGFLFGGYASTVINFGFAGYLGYQGAWPAAGIAAASATGLLSMIVPSVWIYPILGRGMNPKYRIAKKLFGIEFPFEKDLS